MLLWKIKGVLLTPRIPAAPCADRDCHPRGPRPSLVDSTAPQVASGKPLYGGLSFQACGVSPARDRPMRTLRTQEPWEKGAAFLYFVAVNSPINVQAPGGAATLPSRARGGRVSTTSRWRALGDLTLVMLPLAGSSWYLYRIYNSTIIPADRMRGEGVPILSFFDPLPRTARTLRCKGSLLLVLFFPSCGRSRGVGAVVFSLSEDTDYYHTCIRRSLRFSRCRCFPHFARACCHSRYPIGSASRGLGMLQDR